MLADDSLDRFIDRSKPRLSIPSFSRHTVPLPKMPAGPAWLGPPECDRCLARALRQRLDGFLNAFGIDALVADLLPETAGAFLVGADVVELALEAVLEQRAAETRPQAGLHVPTLGHEHERRLGEHRHRVLVPDVQRG